VSSHYREQFARSEAGTGAHPAWLAAVRRAAIDRFDELGLPTRKDEAWKYTPTTAIARGGFVATVDPVAQLNPDDIVRIFGSPTGDCRLVFENGRYSAPLSSPGPSGAPLARNLGAMLCDDPGPIERSLSMGPESLVRPFDALNLAFARDGAFVAIDAANSGRSIELLFVATGSADGCISNVRNIIRIADGASATVSIRHASDADAARYLTNVATSVELGDGAKLDLVTVQRESEAALHLASVDVEQRRDSRFRSHHFALGAGLARSEVNTILAGPGAETSLDGLFLADGTQHIDNQTRIEHRAPHGTSSELYKGVLGGRSRGVFNGLVRVHRDAQKTSARQSNPNLLVSDRAHVNAKPTLEIYADDVKCSHGSTIGRLDDDALFYLRARGIDERAARQMLIGAFASELVDGVPGEALRARVEAWVSRKLDAVALRVHS